MFDKSQLMRGTLEGCILKIISLKITYGYEIMLTLNAYGFEDIREGTIYPLLVRLEKKGFITAEFKPSPLGPSRKYYAIAAEGMETLKEFESYWKSISKAVNTIFVLEE
ncbi:PadR family transcriptional regulator [Desulfoscipio sp. XC116]|uniref:PadR family transcriptional regulator n=1 Tax=Desulfoscipio sp. XC116 TaxID=3144975 RepID=UPI00325B3C5F